MSDKLTSIIIERIKKEGPLTFAEFMEMALYYPTLGYYTSLGDKIGASGDFYTAPELSEIFGSTLAIQFYDMWHSLEKPSKMQIVECGAGRGKLAQDVLKAISLKYRDFFEAVQYHVVELSNAMFEVQKQVLARNNLKQKVVWSAGLEGVGKNAVRGCIFANELIDAMPVHRVRMTQHGLKEIYVDHRKGKFIEVTDKVSTPELKRFFYDQEITLFEGQEAEVNLRARDWIKAAASCLEEGFLLIADYGMEKEKLYTASRMKGTLRCYRRHKVSEEPYKNIGKQDITSHVNFSALIKWGRESGLRKIGLIPQQKFLLNLGVLDFLKEQESYSFNLEIYRKTSAVKKLIMPTGMGTIFKVLVMYKGVGLPSLKGFADSF